MLPRVGGQQDALGTAVAQQREPRSGGGAGRGSGTTSGGSVVGCPGSADGADGSVARSARRRFLTERSERLQDEERNQHRQKPLATSRAPTAPVFRSWWNLEEPLLRNSDDVVCFQSQVGGVLGL